MAIIIIPGILEPNGSLSLPEVDLPKDYFECLCHNGNYYFFFTKEERDGFYDEQGIPHD